MVARPARILVIDDAPDFRAFMEALLTHQGYRVITAASMTEALTLLAGERPHLVVADLLMPDTAPAAVVDRLVEVRRRYAVPVLLCSVAVLQIEGLRARLEREGIEVLLKPFEMDDLLDRIAQLLERGSSSGGAGWGGK